MVGPPGAGKSSVGRRVAERLGVPFADTDHLIETRTSMSISDIFVDSGESHFRALEKAAVAAALRDHDGVLSLGGGAVLDPDTRALLTGAPTVWLQVGASSGAHRVGLNVARPLLLGNVRGRLSALLAERGPLYAEVARVVVDTEGHTPAEVVDTIVDELRLAEDRA